MAGLLSAAEAPVDESNHKHGREGYSPHLTADVNDTLAHAPTTAAAGAAHADANTAVPSPSEEESSDVRTSVQLLYQREVETAESSTRDGRISGGAMLDMDAEMAGLVPAEDSEPAVHAMISLEQEVAGLTPEADMSQDHNASHSSPLTGQYANSCMLPSNMITGKVAYVARLCHQAALHAYTARIDNKALLYPAHYSISAFHCQYQSFSA